MVLHRPGRLATPEQGQSCYEGLCGDKSGEIVVVKL